MQAIQVVRVMHSMLQWKWTIDSSGANDTSNASKASNASIASNEGFLTLNGNNASNANIISLLKVTQVMLVKVKSWK